MEHYTIEMEEVKRIALIAHDRMKPELLEWVKFNKGTLSHHRLFATGSTGTMVKRATGLDVVCFKSGPIGGDQQIGSRIVENDIDMLIFFWDPLEPQPHDPDVKALLRIAVLYNIPTASNRSTADFIISSGLIKSHYDRLVPDYEKHLPKI
jgi:methylglyoxal synthase